MSDQVRGSIARGRQAGRDAANAIHSVLVLAFIALCVGVAVAVQTRPGKIAFALLGALAFSGVIR